MDEPAGYGRQGLVAGDMAAKGMADMKDMGGKMMGGMGGMFGKK